MPKYKMIITNISIPKDTIYFVETLEIINII